jgi:hypothetical protein
MEWLHAIAAAGVRGRGHYHRLPRRISSPATRTTPKISAKATIPRAKTEAGLHHDRRSIAASDRSNAAIRSAYLTTSIRPLRYSGVGDTPWLLPCGPAKGSCSQRREYIEFLPAATVTRRSPLYPTLTAALWAASAKRPDQKTYTSALLMSVLKLTR